MGRQSDPFGYLPTQPKGQENPCFECGTGTKGTHHVIPVVLGGTKVIPLCERCHSVVHGGVINAGLIKEGLRTARAKGIKLGAPIKVTQDIALKVSKMRSEGLSFSDISKSLGISVGAAHSAVKRLNSVTTKQTGTDRGR